MMEKEHNYFNFLYKEETKIILKNWILHFLFAIIGNYFSNSPQASYSTGKPLPATEREKRLRETVGK